MTVDPSAQALRSDDEMIAPNRVFAHFNGSPAGYFPATCLAPVAGEDHKLKIRFDDGTVAIVGDFNVKRLELQPGDSAKVFREGLRPHTYVVKELRDKLTDLSREGETTTLVTDIFGHRTVSLLPKQRQGREDPGTEVVVPVAEIYQTSTMWSSFKDRGYNHTFSAAGFAAPATPSEQPSPSSTPGSRLRLHAASRTSSVQRVIAASRSSTKNCTRLFSNLVFAITEIADDQARDNTEALVRKHGGWILKDGFHELFDVPAAANSKASRFTLKPSLSRNSAILLADRHCRKSKFFQALALGIPCLATRWVTDSIAAGKLCDWRHYLLASGESSFLGGAICSRTLKYGGKSGAEILKLQNMIDLREKWLEGKRVLLVGLAHQMGAYVFIAFALGALEVGVAQSTEEARSVLESSGGNDSVAGERAGWDWVCVHEEERAVNDDAQEAETGGRKKRKRESEDGGARKKRKVQGDAAVVSDGLEGFDGVKVVGTEYVVQSLILGRLLDEM